MKKVLESRLQELEENYKKLETERIKLLETADVHSKKMLFISGAYEELKLLIDKYYKQCEPEATSKQA